MLEELREKFSELSVSLFPVKRNPDISGTEQGVLDLLPVRGERNPIRPVKVEEKADKLYESGDLEVTGSRARKILYELNDLGLTEKSGGGFFRKPPEKIYGVDVSKSLTVSAITFFMGLFFVLLGMFGFTLPTVIVGIVIVVWSFLSMNLSLPREKRSESE